MGKSRIYEILKAGEVICNIGQVTKDDRRLLDSLTKTGAVIKWRGYWFPVAGASHGIGPLKTCWGLARPTTYDGEQKCLASPS